jgi:phosphonate transport system substrate-binding protein
MVTAVIYEEFSAFHRAIEQKEVDVVIMSTLDYLTLEERGFLEPVLVGRTSVGPMREYVVLAREDRAVSDITQMSGMSILVETGGSGRTPLIWLDVFLSQQKCSESDAFFKEVNHVEKASQAVLPVFFNKVDGCLTTMSGFQTMVELNPQLGSAFRIVARSPKLLRGVICLRAGYDEELKNTVIDVLERLHEDPDGQQILVVMREEEVVPFQPQYLDSTRELYRHYQSVGGER